MAEDKRKAARARSIASKALRDRHKEEFEYYVEYLYDLTEDQFLNTRATDLPEYDEEDVSYAGGGWDEV